MRAISSRTPIFALLSFYNQGSPSAHRFPGTILSTIREEVLTAMKRHCFLRFAIAFLTALTPPGMLAQSGESVPLGDVARSLHHSGQAAPPVVIDNDNLSQITAQIENRRANASPVFSFKAADNTFRMALPDGTCSLSFDAKATALLVAPSVTKELPESELAKLEGPASIKGDTLQVALYNATNWNLKEITVGLTLVRRTQDHDAAFHGEARLVPAVAKENPSVVGKPRDLTWLLHLRGTAAPQETAIFREKLGANLSPDQEWHWSILQAKGIPPRPLSTAPDSESGLSTSVRP